MKFCRWFLLAALLVPAASQAQIRGPLDEQATEYSVWDSASRLTLALGGNYEWYAAEGSEPEPTFDKEFSAGGYAAWNLVPKLSLIGQSIYMFDNQHIRTAFGGNYGFYEGPISLGLAIAYEWTYAVGDEPTQEPGKEWNTSLRGAYPLNSWLVAAGSAAYGLDTKTIRTSLGLRALVKKPKL